MANQLVPLVYVQGDTLPAISCVYQVSDPVSGNVTAIDITGYVFTLVFLKGTTQITKTATLDNPTQGLFSFHFAQGDLDTAGTFTARITMTTFAGDKQSWQNLSLAVQSRVGT